VTLKRTGFWLRVLSGAIDALVGLLLAMLLSGTTGRWFAGRSFVMLSIGSPDTFWRGPVPMVIGIFGPLVYGLPFALLLVLLPEALAGAGPGKWALGLSVAAPDCGEGPRGRRWLRWIIKCAGLWSMALALVLGSAPVAGLACLLAASVLLGCLPAAAGASLALHDRLAGTSVCRIRRAQS
jgi:hypothetical protein